MTTTLELHPFENGYMRARQDAADHTHTPAAVVSLNGHEYAAGYAAFSCSHRVGNLRKAWRTFRRALRCAHSLAKSRALPWWLRTMLVIGCIQIPVLPVDEIFLATALGIIAVFYRSTLRTAWTESAR